VRPEADALAGELAVQALDAGLEPRIGQGEPQVAKAQLQQLFVLEAGPGRARPAPNSIVQRISSRTAT
jgi:hypothetical protein